jgi:hypothetical protein
MSPILGIYASQISGKLWEPAGGYDALWSTTVASGGVSSITISGIPTGYKHLQIRVSMTTATAGYGMLVRFNSDSGSNYVQHYLYGTGATAAALAYTAQTEANLFGTSTGSSTTQPSVAVGDILDYANTNKYKTVRSLSGVDKNGSGEISLISSLWMNTAAITSITIEPRGVNYSQYSSFALYGVK